MLRDLAKDSALEHTSGMKARGASPSERSLGGAERLAGSPMQPAQFVLEGSDPASISSREEHSGLMGSRPDRLWLSVAARSCR